MLRIAPFSAIRPLPNHVARVASVPYDVVDSNEARALAADSPLSFLHVIRPEICLPEGTDPHADAVYDAGRASLDRLLRDGILVQDDSPSIFLYRQVMNHRVQLGLVCCCHLEDYESGVILRHEKTRRDKEDDRTRHMLTVNAHTGPVFLTYRDRADVDECVRSDTSGRPLYHFNAPDSVTHTVWRAKNPQAYIDAFAAVPVAYVADGHHRSASAARAGADRRARNADHRGDEEYNWFLCVLFPASQLSILPYNRVLRDLNGLSVDQLLTRLGEVGTVTVTDQPSPEDSGVFCVYVDGRWHRVELDPATIDAGHPIHGLDVALLEERILRPVFGIEDVRTDPRIDFVGGVRGTAALEVRVDTGGWAAAVSMHATSIDQLMAVADAGLVMPPKSTWFEPKLRSGLFVHSLEGRREAVTGAGR